MHSIELEGRASKGGKSGNADKSVHSASTSKATSSRRGAAQLLVRYRLCDDPPGKIREATGRYGWTLLNLYRAGAAGLTTLERPAPRWSHYVFELRKMGVNIETEYEKHSGDFAGTHGRYRLLSPISIIEVVEPGGGAAMSKPLKSSRGKSRILSKPPVPLQPRKVRLKATIGERQIEVTRRGDALMLKLLAEAGGNWIEPRAVGAHGVTLTKHARLLRSEFSLPIESECVQYGSRFYNRHRLKAPIVIDGGEHV